MEFLHKDEFEQLHERSFDYPVVLKQPGKQSNNVDLFLSADEISQVTSVDELIALIEQQVS